MYVKKGMPKTEVIVIVLISGAPSSLIAQIYNNFPTDTKFHILLYPLYSLSVIIDKLGADCIDNQ